MRPTRPTNKMPKDTLVSPTSHGLFAASATRCSRRARPQLSFALHGHGKAKTIFPPKRSIAGQLGAYSSSSSSASEAGQPQPCHLCPDTAFPSKQDWLQHVQEQQGGYACELNDLCSGMISLAYDLRAMKIDFSDLEAIQTTKGSFDIAMRTALVPTVFPSRLGSRCHTETVPSLSGQQYEQHGYTRDEDRDIDGVLAVVTRLREHIGVQVDVLSFTSISKEYFSNAFKDSQGNLYRHQPSAIAVCQAHRGQVTYRHNAVVKSDSVLLTMMLLWEQLRLVYKKPDTWLPGINNGYDCPTKFASNWSSRHFTPHILGLSEEQYQVVDVVALALSIHECLEWKAEETETQSGYFSWLGFSLYHFDSKVVGAKVAKLAFQYLPSVPFL